ncbi:chromosome transmission fidelity-like protein [Wolffia australiana]
MQIQVQCACGDGGCLEWAIVELQGVVEANSSIQDQIQNFEIGRLCCTSQSAYTFTVGYHELSGKKVPLKKPFLVLKKRKEKLQNGEESSTTALEVVGIIRHRILFKDRPKALISAPQKKEKKAG